MRFIIIQIKCVGLFIGKHFSQIISLSAFIVSLVALKVSFMNINNANRQFKINSKASKELFNLNLNNSKALNDSLINQIAKLQLLTNKQIEITDEQLKITKSSLYDQILSKRPLIALVENFITDTNKLVGDLFAPNICTTLKNVGQRPAYEVNVFPFIITSDFSDVVKPYQNDLSIMIEPETDYTKKWLPKFNKKYKDNFYYCYLISYYDKSTEKYFKEESFWHHYKLRGKFEFYSCSELEKSKLRIKMGIKNCK